MSKLPVGEVRMLAVVGVEADPNFGEEIMKEGVADLRLADVGVDSGVGLSARGAGGSFFFLKMLANSFLELLSFSTGLGVVGDDGTSTTVGRS